MKNKSTTFNFEILRHLRKERNLTLEDISAKSGVSFAVISKLERNIGNPGLDTLKQIAKALGISMSELVAMIEIRESEVRRETKDSSNGFNFRRVIYTNAKVICVTGKKGSNLAHPEVHENDTEIVFVQKGKVKVTLPTGDRLLSNGESIQFDALLGHTYEVIEDCEMVIVHTRKDKKF